jgi:hypothetical protein
MSLVTNVTSVTSVTSVVKLRGILQSVTLLSVILQCFAQLSVILPNVIFQSVVELSVIMLKVVAPTRYCLVLLFHLSDLKRNYILGSTDQLVLEEQFKAPRHSL